MGKDSCSRGRPVSRSTVTPCLARSRCDVHRPCGAGPVRTRPPRSDPGSWSWPHTWESICCRVSTWPGWRIRSSSRANPRAVRSTSSPSTPTLRVRSSCPASSRNRRCSTKAPSSRFSMPLNSSARAAMSSRPPETSMLRVKSSSVTCAAVCRTRRTGRRIRGPRSHGRARCRGPPWGSWRRKGRQRSSSFSSSRIGVVGTQRTKRRLRGVLSPFTQASEGF